MVVTMQIDVSPRVTEGTLEQLATVMGMLPGLALRKEASDGKGWDEVPLSKIGAREAGERQ